MRETLGALRGRGGASAGVVCVCVGGDPECMRTPAGAGYPRVCVWGEAPEEWADASGAEEQGRAAAAPQPKRYSGLYEHS